MALKQNLSCIIFRPKDTWSRATLPDQSYTISPWNQTDVSYSKSSIAFEPEYADFQADRITKIETCSMQEYIFQPWNHCVPNSWPNSLKSYQEMKGIFNKKWKSEETHRHKIQQEWNPPWSSSWHSLTVSATIGFIKTLWYVFDIKMKYWISKGCKA